MARIEKKRRLFQRRRICRFCADKELAINFHDIGNLKPFITERGKLIPARITGNCRTHQRSVTREVKKARNVAFLPFAPQRATF